MTPLEIDKITEKLREPYRAMILDNVLGKHDNKLLGLNVLITGPAASGKTTEARAYAKALVAAGLAPPGEILSIDPGSDILRFPPMPGFAGFDEHPLKAGKTSIIIIDEADKQLGQNDAASKFLIKQLSEPDFIIIMTAYTNDFVKQLSPELQARMPENIRTEKSFTPEEIQVHREAQREKRKRLQQEWKSAQNTAAWRKLKTFNVSSGKDIGAPAKARFVKKPEHQL